MNRKQKSIKEILSDWQDYDSNFFYQSVLTALREEEYRKLQELGSSTGTESAMRFLQGEIRTLKRMQTFADKHKEHLMNQL